MTAAAAEEPDPPAGLAPREPAAPETPAPGPADTGVPVTSWLEAQIALAREGFSSGPIDGVGGAQSAAALRAYQESRDLPATGALDAATRANLVLTAPPLTQLVLTAEDLARLQPLEPTWVGKSQQSALDYDDKRPVDYFNCPTLLISAACVNTIYALQTWTGYSLQGKRSLEGATKDPIDLLRYFFLAECPYLGGSTETEDEEEQSEFAPKRGNFY